IIVGNHGGRVSQSHPASIENLSAIVKTVGKKIKIIYDGGVRNGEDVFKALALGADLVMIGRPFVTAVLGGGADGVGVLINQLKMQLARTMLIAGADKVSDIKSNMINE
ncbi:MAG: alpha-hydroxy-acid oxidizing protein, partial [Spirochaetales bacterium]|nr:alpha-hydroxy-acid oxidizing protein [Spirochaetales bacterium]